MFKRWLSKKLVVQGFLVAGAVSITFDPRVTAVTVPAVFRDHPSATLVFDTDVEDLSVDDLGIRGTLTFDGVLAPAFVPWAAVFVAGHEEMGMVAWTEDVPREAFDEVPEEAVLPPVEAVALGNIAAQQRRARPAWLKILS